MKKMNNKGFSLVELIIVIAIMAVLVGVLAPQFLKYVESSRVQKDESAVAEVQNAVMIACSVEKVYNSLPASGTSVTVATTSITGGTSDLLSELNMVVPASDITFSSKAHTGGSYVINIAIDASTGMVSVGGHW
ncbi:MAG: type II secretion system GspH family protein [Clostridium sp.]|nr:type II secretion system GspH family protein [Acetatifactor muris]MCM1526033.1 type II secretion system GspH family protein [Bacteroides sp.]MCM1562207.1 type II secretion system GspH family protein [Clostridium sp.]